MSFGTRLREQREALGLKQSELGKLLGVTGSAIGNYETGVSSPKADILYRVFDVLKCDANFLFQDEMRDPETDDFSVPEIRMIKKYRALDEHGKEMVDLVLERESERMEKEAAAAKPEREEKVIPFPKPKAKTTHGGIVTIEVFEEPAAAGTGNALSSAPASHMEQYPEQFIHTQADFGVVISGRSMEPKYPDKCVVFVKSTPVVEPGEVGVFLLDGQAYIKQLQVEEETGRVCLHSINPECGDVEVPPYADLRVQGKVLGGYDPAAKAQIW